MDNYSASNAEVVLCSDKHAVFNFELSGNKYSLTIDVENCNSFVYEFRCCEKKVLENRVLHESVACKITDAVVHEDDGEVFMYIHLLKKKNKIVVRFEVGGHGVIGYCSVYHAEENDDFEAWKLSSEHQFRLA